jgi:hypothetical protein
MYESWRRRLLDEARAVGSDLEIPSCDVIARTFDGWRNARALALPKDPG